MTMLSRQEFNVLGRQDLYTCIQLVCMTLNPGEEFQENWHIELMASELMAIYRGENRRVIFNLPPRNLKSICISVAFVAWVLGLDPTRRFLVVSYGMELAEKLARATRTIMQTDWYKAMFPGTLLSAARTASHDFETTKGGGRMAASRGGPITGRGAHFIIVDDPLKSDEAQNDNAREAVNEWLRSTLTSRSDKKKTSAFILAMQRLHADDLTGDQLKTGTWRHVCLPAVAPEDRLLNFPTPWGERWVFWPAGEALHPEREPLEVLAEIRAMQGEFHYNAQFLQNPIPRAGNLVPIERFQTYDDQTKPTNFKETIFSIDTASKGGEQSHYSVVTHWGRNDEKIWLLNVWRFKASYHLLKARVLALHQEYRPDRMLIEDAAAGQQLIQEFKNAGIYGVIAITPKGDKETRMALACILIEGGQVYIPTSAGWLGDYLRELAGFPHFGADDQVDSTSQALNWFRNQRYEPSIITYYRERAEREANPPLGPTLVLKAPPDCNYATGLEGAQYWRQADGYFYIPERDARLLLRAWGWSVMQQPPD